CSFRTGTATNLIVGSLTSTCGCRLAFPVGIEEVEDGCHIRAGYVAVGSTRYLDVLDLNSQLLHFGNHGAGAGDRDDIVRIAMHYDFRDSTHFFHRRSISCSGNWPPRRPESG